MTSVNFPHRSGSEALTGTHSQAQGPCRVTHHCKCLAVIIYYYYYYVNYKNKIIFYYYKQEDTYKMTQFLLTYLGKIKRIKWESFCLLKSHDLDVKSPGRIVALGNGIEKISEAIIWIFLGKPCCHFHGQVFDALVSL